MTNQTWPPEISFKTQKKLITLQIIILLKLLSPLIVILTLIVLWLVSIEFRNLFVTTTIRCDREQFSIINSCSGFTKIHKGTTSAITDISLRYVAQMRKNNVKVDSLVIYTKSTSKLHSNHTYLLGENLSEAELLWLVQELREWLNIHEQLPDNITGV